jgi:hypothetical protein
MSSSQAAAESAGGADVVLGGGLRGGVTVIWGVGLRLGSGRGGASGGSEGRELVEVGSIRKRSPAPNGTKLSRTLDLETT